MLLHFVAGLLLQGGIIPGEWPGEGISRGIHHSLTQKSGHEASVQQEIAGGSLASAPAS